MLGVPRPDTAVCVGCEGIPFEFTRLGLRVPMLVVSPWAEKGRVVHGEGGVDAKAGAWEHSSLEATLRASVPGWPQAPLTKRSAWARPLDPLWERTKLEKPRADCPKKLPEVPKHSPVHEGVQRDGESEAVTDLQKELLVLAEGARRGAARGPHASPPLDEKERVLNALRESGALDSRFSAGRYAVRAIADVLRTAQS